MWTTVQSSDRACGGAIRGHARGAIRGRDGGENCDAKDVKLWMFGGAAGAYDWEVLPVRFQPSVPTAFAT